jgi:tetratricopeptide (TPR) repeat protein
MGTTKAVAHKHYLSPEARFADAYYHLRIKDYKKAFGLFKELAGSVDEFGKTSSRTLLPFLVQSGVMSGNGSAADLYGEAYRKQIGEDFYYHLAAAFQYYGKGNHKQALESLDRARRTLPDEPSQYDSNSFSPLYQLLEASERLYEDSKDDAYGALALEWARLYQDVEPTTAWLYAMEAKLAHTKEARLRPLALTLYLDPRSERIATISKNEKNEALAWLRQNNPFSVPDGKQENRDI